MYRVAIPLILLISRASAQSFELSLAAPPFSVEPVIRGSQLVQASGSAFVLTNSAIGALGDADLLLLKLNASGDIVHSLRLGDTEGLGYHDVGTEAVEVNDGLYICGYTRSIDTASTPTFTSFLLRTDTALNIQWQKNYILPGPLELYANSMTATDNGQLLIAGQVNDGAEFHTMLMKVAANGSVLWMKQYAIDFGERVQCIRELPGGDILLSGNVVFGFELVLPFAFKVDLNGNFIWGRYYNYPPSSFVEQSNFLFIRAQSADDILLCGHTDVMGAGGQDVYVVDIDSSGAVIWARTYGASQFEFPSAAHYDADNDEVVLLGSTSSFSGSFTPLPMAMRIAPSGALLGAALYGDTANTSPALLDHCQRIDATHRIVSGWRDLPFNDRYIAGADDGLANTCNTHPFAPGVATQTCASGAFSAVVSTPFCLQNDLPFGAFSFSGDSVLCATTTSLVEGSTAPALAISPNPADAVALLRLMSPLCERDQVQLLDAQGRLVRTERGAGLSVCILRNGLAAGIYTVRVLYTNAASQWIRLVWR